MRPQDLLTLSSVATVFNLISALCAFQIHIPTFVIGVYPDQLASYEAS